MSALASLVENYTDSEDDLSENETQNESIKLKSVIKIVDNSASSNGTNNQIENDSDDHIDEKLKDKLQENYIDNSVLNTSTNDEFKDLIGSDEIYIPEENNQLIEIEEEKNDNFYLEKTVENQNNEDPFELDSPPLSPVTFHKRLIGLNPDNIQIPKGPKVDKCSQELLDKIAHLHNLMKQGRNMTEIIQKKKSYRNPSIYEKLIAYCNIDELGTNFPPEIYQSHCWNKNDYYEVLSKKQQDLMDKLDREKKERSKVVFISGTAKKSNHVPSESVRKKTKWDVPGTSKNVGTLINSDIIMKKREKATATIQSFYK